jgi:hypothetical protein
MDIKVTKSTLPADSLIQKYLPADYVDVFAAIAPENERLTPDNLLIGLWTDFPKQFPEMVRSGGNYGFVDIPAKNGNETVMQLSDKHLTVRLSVHIASITDNQLKISITTVVHYRNLLGKVYFFMIRPFHKFIVKIIARRGIKRLLHNLL